MMLKGNKLNSICKLVEWEIVGDSSASVNRISIDSRNHLSTKQTLFIALKGKNRDGHDFISDAYNKGVRNFLVQTNLADVYPKANLIIVKDTLLALQKWAKNHRAKFNIPVIAITGSNGKTIVKEWLYYFLKSKYNISRSPKSYNSQIGVPLLFWW